MSDARNNKGRVAMSLLWSALPLLTLGFGTPMTMLYAAAKKRSALLAAATTIYTAVLVTAVATNGSAMTALFLTINALVATIHSLAVRSRVFELDADSEPRRSTLADQQLRALTNFVESEEAREEARDIVEKTPRLALELGIGRVDRADREFPDGGLIDVNNVAADALAQAMDVSLDVARSIVRVRDAHGGYVSLEDLSIRLNLEPDALMHVEERLVFPPMSRAQSLEQ